MRSRLVSWFLLQIFGIENTSRSKNWQKNFNCQKFEKKVKLLKKKEKEGVISQKKEKFGKITKNNEKEVKRRKKEDAGHPEDAHKNRRNKQNFSNLNNTIHIKHCHKFKYHHISI